MKSDPEDLSEKLDELQKEVSELRESQKEREISFLRSLKTLADDMADYSSGERPDIPRAAILGVVFAYLRPRLIVTLAGIGAVLLGALQFWILYNQTEILDSQLQVSVQQGELLASQTSSNRVSAISAVLASVEIGDIESERTAVAQLIPFVVDAYYTFIGHIKLDSAYSSIAERVIAETAPLHSEEEAEDFVVVTLGYIGLIFEAFDKVITAENHREFTVYPEQDVLLQLEELNQHIATLNRKTSNVELFADEWYFDGGKAFYPSDTTMGRELVGIYRRLVELDKRIDDLDDLPYVEDTSLIYPHGVPPGGPYMTQFPTDYIHAVDTMNDLLSDWCGLPGPINEIYAEELKDDEKAKTLCQDFMLFRYIPGNDHIPDGLREENSETDTSSN